MNRVEHPALDILEPLILGENRILRVDDLERVSAFCGIFFSMLDRDHLPTSAIGQAERSYIYEHRQLPENWCVLIGRHQSPKWHFRFHHIGAVGSREINIPPPKSPNVQICTVGIGQLILHAMSAQGWQPLPSAQRRAAWANSFGMALIHPDPYEIDWANMPVLPTDHIERCASAVAQRSFAKGFEGGATFKP
ncbi:hypothetical protein ABC955_09140 [Citromicrobium bathyomarinum]